MVKKILITIILHCLVLPCITIYAQDWQWAVRMGGAYGDLNNNNPDEEVNDIATDAMGNIYVCGRITDSCDFNGLIPDTTIGGDDIFLAKFDCEGNPIWVRIAGNPSDGDIANSLVLDNFGHIYLTGMLEGNDGSRPITFIDSTYYENTTDMFIAKFDTSGNFDWVKIVGPGNTQIGTDGYKIAIDAQGKISVLTYADQPGIFLQGDSIYERGIYIARFDSSGNLENLLNLGFFGQETIYRDMQIGPDNQYYLTGTFGDDSLSLGGQTIYRINVPLGHDLFMFKIDTSGIAQWNIHLGSTTYTALTGYGIDFDNSGNIILTGSAVNGIILGNDTFQNSLSANPGLDFPFVAKISPQGIPIWATNTNCKYGSRSEGGGVVKSNGNIMISGFFSGPAKMGSDSLNSNGAQDIFLAEISSTGTVLHGYDLSGNGSSESALCMTRDWNDNIFIGGAFDGTLYYNGGNILSAGGNTDGLIAKWGNSLCTVGINDIVSNSLNSEIKIYPNPVQSKMIVSWSSTSSESLLSVFDILGNCLLKEKYQGVTGQNMITFELSNLSPGMYFITIEEHNISRSAKFIKD